MFGFLKKIKIPTAFRDRKTDISVDVINNMYTLELSLTPETTVEDLIHELNRVLADRFFSLSRLLIFGRFLGTSSCRTKTLTSPSTPPASRTSLRESCPPLRSSKSWKGSFPSRPRKQKSRSLSQANCTSPWRPQSLCPSSGSRRGLTGTTWFAEACFCAAWTTCWRLPPRPPRSWPIWAASSTSTRSRT